MTNEEALKRLIYFKQKGKTELLTKVIKSDAIGEQDELVDVCIKAISIHVPKAPIDYPEDHLFKCPTCKDFLVGYWHGRPKRCRCGQLIEWGDL